MAINPKPSRPGAINSRTASQEPITPISRADSHLRIPIISPVPIYRLSPALDEFSLRQTPSRGGTASPAPAKGIRKRIHQYRNLDHAVDLLRQSKNVVILTGAGISTSVGIPDFRSDKGLYSQLSKDLGITEAEEFFSLDYFVHNTAEFLEYVKRVIPEAVLGQDGCYRSVKSATSAKDGKTSVPKFSLTHAFLALLDSKQKLSTNYTQNIDGLEIAAGVSRANLIQCHGSWDSASCLTCGRSSAAKKYLPVVFQGNVPFCKCKLDAEQKKTKRSKKKASRKRSWDDFDSDHSSDNGTQAPRGLLKPDITFFNERLAGSFGERLEEDKRKIDLLIIIGTSLKVGPVQDMLYQISPKVPQIFISKERFSGALCNLPGVQVDIELLGECDMIIEEICRRAGWLEELKTFCWTPGQTKIKRFVTQTKSLDPDTFTDCEPTETKRFRSGANKKLKFEKTMATDGESEPRGEERSSHVAQEHASPNRTAMVKDANRTAQSISQESEKNMVHQVRLEQDAGGTRKPTAIVKDSNKLGSDSSMISSASNTGSRVKIELVEGTAHQWRVTRK